MKNITLWIVIGAIALFVLGMFGVMFLPFGWNNSAFGFGCASGWNGYGMMGNRGFMPMMGGWGMMPFGIFGMLFMWLVPLGVIGLIIAGVVWLARSLTQPKP